MVTKLKKSVALILAMIMTLTLAACGNDHGSTEKTKTASQTQEAAEVITSKRIPDFEKGSYYNYISLKT